MNMPFKLLNNKKIPYDFSDDKVDRLSKTTDSLGDVLIKSGYGYMVDHLSKIRLAAEQRNVKEFKNNVLSNELFGGSGSMRDFYIENRDLRAAFIIQFIVLIDIFTEIGIRNKYINKVKKELKLRMETKKVKFE